MHGSCSCCRTHQAKMQAFAPHEPRQRLRIAVLQQPRGGVRFAVMQYCKLGVYTQPYQVSKAFAACIWCWILEYRSFLNCKWFIVQSLPKKSTQKHDDVMQRATTELVEKHTRAREERALELYTYMYMFCMQNQELTPVSNCILNQVQWVQFHPGCTLIDCTRSQIMPSSATAAATAVRLQSTAWT